ncbi:MAG: apolipoprotein N-acyltransferase [Bifidobacteriaceae bacterium]|jgi:apolipoprotein N-acyltransferase|nr:apolipoprotein N-acyltransferase [Bifidobacteriaceae bacterium]
MPGRRKNWIIWVLTALAGFICYLAFRPAGWWFAAPVALGLLYLVLGRLGPWRGLAAALLFGLAEFLPMLTWAYNAAGLLPYLALSIASAVLLALSGLAYGYARYLVGGQQRGRGAGRRVDGAAAGGGRVDGAVLRSRRDDGRRADGAGARRRAGGAAMEVGGHVAGQRVGGDGAERRADRASAGFSKADRKRAGASRGVVRTASASLMDALLFALAFTGADTLRQFFPFGGFPWGRLGFTQVDGPMARWAWLGGVPLVGLAAALAGALAVVMLRALVAASGKGVGGRGRNWRTAAWAAGLLVAVVAVPLALPVSADAQDGTLAVGAVQGDVEVTSEGLFAQQREVLENHVEVSHELAQDVGRGSLDVVLWPENSTDIDPRTDERAYEAIDGAAEALGAPVLVGAMQYVNRSNRYNQGLLWRAGLGVVDIYSKQHPAPFAEYMPARSFFRLFTKKVDLINTDMLPGETVGLMPFSAEVLGREVALGDVICFEVAYDQIVADVVAAGAEAVVVQTNNASFGFSEESTQQFAMTRLRAIEHGRATVQISTVGVSAAVAPDGSLLTPMTSLFEPAYFTADLPLRTSLTPATRIGGVLCWALILGPLALAVAGVGARLVGGRR